MVRDYRSSKEGWVSFFFFFTVVFSADKGINLSCRSPGRFFVAHEIKMILAHLFANYELQRIEKRPEPIWLGATIVPPLGATIKVRRKRPVG